MSAGRRAPGGGRPPGSPARKPRTSRATGKRVPDDVSAEAIAIRPARGDDRDFILSLAPRFVAFDLPAGREPRATLAAINAEIERALREAQPGDAFFIAQDARGERAGFLHLQVQRDFFSGVRACHLADVVVTIGRDGHGIGRTLLGYAETWAREHRCRLLTLTVFPGNARARALYERAGYGTDLLRMMKPLGP